MGGAISFRSAVHIHVRLRVMLWFPGSAPPPGDLKSMNTLIVIRFTFNTQNLPPRDRAWDRGVRWGWTGMLEQHHRSRRGGWKL